MNLHYAKYLILFLLSFSIHAEVYKYTDSDGKLHFSDKPIANSQSYLIKNLNTSDSRAGSFIHDSLNRGKVIMLSSEGCQPCRDAVRYFQKNNIEFIDFDIDKDSFAGDYFKSSRFLGTPVILYQDRYMLGWSVKGFEGFYSRH